MKADPWSVPTVTLPAETFAGYTETICRLTRRLDELMFAALRAGADPEKLLEELSHAP